MHFGILLIFSIWLSDKSKIMIGSSSRHLGTLFKRFYCKYKHYSLGRARLLIFVSEFPSKYRVFRLLNNFRSGQMFKAINSQLINLTFIVQVKDIVQLWIRIVQFLVTFYHLHQLFFTYFFLTHFKFWIGF